MLDSNEVTSHKRISICKYYNILTIINKKSTFFTFRIEVTSNIILYISFKIQDITLFEEFYSKQQNKNVSSNFFKHGIVTLRQLNLGKP